MANMTKIVCSISHQEVESETSLAVQWPRLCVPNAGGPGSILGQGTGSHTPQLMPGASPKIKKVNIIKEAKSASLSLESGLAFPLTWISNVMKMAVYQFHAWSSRGLTFPLTVLFLCFALLTFVFIF